MNGKGIPVAGTKELATDIFVKAWKQIENVITTARTIERILFFIVFFSFNNIVNFPL